MYDLIVLRSLLIFLLCRFNKRPCGRWLDRLIGHQVFPSPLKPLVETEINLLKLIKDDFGFCFQSAVHFNYFTTRVYTYI